MFLFVTLALNCCGSWLEVDGSKGFVLHNVDHGLLAQFKNRKKGHHNTQAPFLRVEQGLELAKTTNLERRQHMRHARAHRQGLACNGMIAVDASAFGHIAQRHQQFLHRDVWKRYVTLYVGSDDLELMCLALHARQGLNVLGGLLDTFVFLQAPHQLSPGVVLFTVLFLSAR